MIPIKKVLRILLESEIENKKHLAINEQVFDELCAICSQIENGAVYKKAHGFDVEIDQKTLDTIVSLRFQSALSPAGDAKGIKIL